VYTETGTHGSNREGQGIISLLDSTKEQAKQSIEKYSDFLLEKVEAGSQVRVDIKQLKRSSDDKLTDELVESLLFLPEKNHNI
jgi:hypothetical protein